MPLSSWRDRAACLDADPELFFPIGETSTGDIAQIADAKSFCDRCVSLDECLAWAVTEKINDGIWGGQTATERNIIKRRLARERAALNETNRSPDRALEPDEEMMVAVAEAREKIIDAKERGWTVAQISAATTIRKEGIRLIVLGRYKNMKRRTHHLIMSADLDGSPVPVEPGMERVDA